MNLPSPAALACCLVVLTPPHLFAGEPAPMIESTIKVEAEDLALGDFFSTGWDTAWVRRPRGEGTPDLSMLRVQHNGIANLFRADFGSQDNLDTSSTSGIETLTGTVEFTLNSRVMLAFAGNYRWVDSRLTNHDDESSSWSSFARLQLRETATSVLAANLRVALPYRDLGEKASTVSLAIAGWQDLAGWGLKRTGLYYHVQEETLAGPSAPGARRNDLTYAVSLARTWTHPDSFFGNATTFVEAYAKTDLDGADPGHSVFTLTPGMRATIAHRHVFIAGLEFPVSHPRPYESIFRFSYLFYF